MPKNSESDVGRPGHARARVVDECAAKARHAALTHHVPYQAALAIEAAVRTLTIGPEAEPQPPITGAPAARAHAEVRHRGDPCQRCDGAGKYGVKTAPMATSMIDCGACGGTGAS
jgi:hypothetical protein